jgi:hypothetical protein
MIKTQTDLARVLKWNQSPIVRVAKIDVSVPAPHFGSSCIGGPIELWGHTEAAKPHGQLIGQAGLHTAEIRHDRNVQIARPNAPGTEIARSVPGQAKTCLPQSPPTRHLEPPGVISKFRE